MPLAEAIGMGAMAGTSLAGNILGSNEAEGGYDDAIDQLMQLYPLLSTNFGAARKLLKKAFQLYKPYRKMGERVLPSLESKLEPGGALYDWRLKEGQRTLDQALAARGIYGSGAGIEASRRLSTELTGEETDKSFGRTLQALLVALEGVRGEAGIRSRIGDMRYDVGKSMIPGYMQAGQYRADMGATRGGMYQSAGMLPFQGYSMYNAYNQPTTPQPTTPQPKTYEWGVSI